MTEDSRTLGILDNIYFIILQYFFFPLVIFGSWFDHVKSWLNVDEKHQVLHITYEEMVKVRAERCC